MHEHGIGSGDRRKRIAGCGASFLILRLHGWRLDGPVPSQTAGLLRLSRFGTIGLPAPLILSDAINQEIMTIPRLSSSNVDPQYEIVEHRPGEPVAAGGADQPSPPPVLDRPRITVRRSEDARARQLRAQLPGQAAQQPQSAAPETQGAAAGSLLGLPTELQIQIAGFLDRESLRSLRGTNRHLSAIATDLVKHISVKSGDELEQALTAYKEGGITKITLSGSAVTDEALSLLKDVTTLKHVVLSGCTQLTDAGLAHLEGMPIKTLDLSWCPNLTDAGLAHLKDMPIQTLNLRGGAQLTDAGLAHLKGMPIQTFDLSLCGRLTDAGLAHFKGMPIQNLHLSWCRRLTDAGLAHFKGMPIQNLDLSWCRRLTDAGLAHLKGMPIQTLDLERCSRISDTGLAHIESMPIQKLTLRHCIGITDAGLAPLRARLGQHLIR